MENNSFTMLDFMYPVYLCRLLDLNPLRYKLEQILSLDVPVSLQLDNVWLQMNV